MALQGGKLAGGNPKNERVDYDFYATDPIAVQKLLEQYQIKGTDVLEPCIGNGNIANTVNKFYGNQKSITGVDIVDRGYPNTILSDYLTWEPEKKFDCIITNPPYSLAKEFVEKSMKLLNSDGQLMMFLKIQFLEGAKRKEMFSKYPPKYIYVFRNRMATWNNGEPLDPNGKRWATTMCHAWFVWEVGNTDEPIVRWLD